MVRTLPSSSPLRGELSSEQRAFFREHGAIHFPGFIDRTTVGSLWKAVEEAQERLVADNVEKVNGTPLKYGVDTDGRRIIQRMAFANQQHPVLAEFLRDPRFNMLLGLIPGEARLGISEKDGLVVNHYVNTDASKFTQMGWHTDSLRDVFLGKRILPMLNVGIHLDDQEPGNGGLRLLTGTHEQSLWNLMFRKRYFLNTEPDAKEVAFDIKAGDLTVHDGRLWHRVERSRLTGEASRRRVMYIPIICGKFAPKHADSPTPFYHRFQHLVK